MDLAQQLQESVLCQFLADRRVLHNAMTDCKYQAVVFYVDLGEGGTISCHRSGQHAGIEYSFPCHVACPFVFPGRNCLGEKMGADIPTLELSYFLGKRVWSKLLTRSQAVEFSSQKNALPQARAAQSSFDGIDCLRDSLCGPLQETRYQCEQLGWRNWLSDHFQ